MNNFWIGLAAGLAYVLIGVGFVTWFKWVEGGKIWEKHALKMAQDDPKISREALTILVLLFWWVFVIFGLVGLVQELTRKKKAADSAQPDTIYIFTGSDAHCYFCQKPFYPDNRGHIFWARNSLGSNPPPGGPGFALACEHCLTERGLVCACHPQPEKAR